MEHPPPGALSLDTLPGIAFVALGMSFFAYCIFKVNRSKRPIIKGVLGGAVFILFALVAWAQDPPFWGQPYVMMGAPLVWVFGVKLFAKF